MKNFKEFINEGFVNKLGSGMVPIGLYSFKYSVKDKNRVGFIERSGENRGMTVKKKGSNFVVLSGDADDHSSLINSLQSFGDISGEVTKF